MVERAKVDRRHFEPLYKKYHEQIFRYILQRVKDMQTATEITSDTFSKALIKLDTYEFRGVPFGSWLYRIAYSQINQWYRTSHQQRTVTIPESLSFEDDETQLSYDTPSMLIEALDTLSEDELALIELRYFEERPLKEVATILEISESNAKVRCHRILKKLKNRINTPE